MSSVDRRLPGMRPRWRFQAGVPIGVPHPGDPARQRQAVGGGPGLAAGPVHGLPGVPRWPEVPPLPPAGPADASKAGGALALPGGGWECLGRKSSGWGQRELTALRELLYKKDTICR